MKTILTQKRAWLTKLVLMMAVVSGTLAEGTKQFMPASTNYGCIQVNDVGRPFALMTNTDPLHRLYFRIASTTEKAYFGFKRHSTSVASTGQFQIKTPSGTIVMGPTNLPNSGTGKITSYTQAVAGPKIGGVPIDGYTPFSFTPATTGDFYMEFSSASNENYRFEFFDLTVVNSSNVPINGRVWSYAWDMNTWAGSNGFSGSFYVYTSEGYVSKVNMNGIQAYGFVTSCNGSGPQNTGDLVVDRRSIDGNSTRPDFKVFLNNPDINVYPSANAPTITDSIEIVGGDIYYGEPVQFTIGVSAPGTIQIIISINGVSGYQAGTTDVLVVSNIVAGTNTIDWDGKDANGEYPAIGSQIEISTGFSAGITHLPIYDPETHSSGFIVDRIRPGTGSAPIRWDDSNFAGGSVNISGGSGNGHSWTTDGGNLRTMNTWWNGYEVENSDQFTVTVQTPLPVEVSDFTANVINNNSTVKIKWITNAEINNALFTVERSVNGTKFEKLVSVNGAGNSTSMHEYEIIDEQPLHGVSYYRIASTSYHGIYRVETKIIRVVIERSAGDPFNLLTIYPNPAAANAGNIQFMLSEALFSEFEIVLINKCGQKLLTQKFIPEDDGISSGHFKLPADIKAGIYHVMLCSDRGIVYRKNMVLHD